MATVEDTDVGRFGDVDAASAPQRFIAWALGSFAGTAVAAGALTRAQADEWLAGLADRARRGRFFFALPFFLARATHPFGPSL